MLDCSLITFLRGSIQRIPPRTVTPFRQAQAATHLFHTIGCGVLPTIHFMRMSLLTENIRLEGILHPTVPRPRFRDQGVRVLSLTSWMR